MLSRVLRETAAGVETSANTVGTHASDPSTHIFEGAADEHSGMDTGENRDRYRTYGLYLSASVRERLDDYLYEEAGVVDLEEYFDPSVSTIPVGDPGADATHDLLVSVVADFATLYDEADFATANALDHDRFALTSLAAEPETIAAARERFEAATIIRETDLRSVHTAILSAWLPAT